MAKEKTLLEKVEAIRDLKTISDYRVAKDTGITYSSVFNFRSGKSKTENITLGAALKYAALYDQLTKSDKSLLS